MDLLKLKSGTDIRGVAIEGVNDQEVTLTDDVVFLLGRAFATWLYKRGCPDQTVVAVGHDCRLSGPRIKNALIHALN